MESTNVWRPNFSNRKQVEEFAKAIYETGMIGMDEEAYNQYVDMICKEYGIKE